MVRATPVFIAMVSLLGASSASAAVVTRVNGSRALVSGPEVMTAHPADHLMIGGNCDLKIMQIVGTKAVVDASACMDRNSLRVGAVAGIASAGLSPEDAALERAMGPSVAGSDTATMNMRMIETQQNNANYVVRGFGIGAGAISLSKKADVKIQDVQTNGFGGSTPVNFLQPTQYVTDTQTAVKPSATASYSWIPRMGVGFMGDLTVSQADNLFVDGTYTYMRPTANIVFGAPKIFYGFAGANYMGIMQQPNYGTTVSPYASLYKDQKVNLKTDVGYQVGAGAVFAKVYEAQLRYSWARVNMDQTLTSTTPGFTNFQEKIQGSYEFSGIEATFAYRF